MVPAESEYRIMTDHDICRMIGMGEQARDDQLAWLDATTTLTEREREVYRAGFEAGWNKCRATMSLHKIRP